MYSNGEGWTFRRANFSLTITPPKKVYTCLEGNFSGQKSTLVIDFISLYKVVIRLMEIPVTVWTEK